MDKFIEELKGLLEKYEAQINVSVSWDESIELEVEMVEGKTEITMSDYSYLELKPEDL